MINLINKFSIKKAHGCNNLSLKMIKLCDKSMYKPLGLRFKIERLGEK